MAEFSQQFEAVYDKKDPKANLSKPESASAYTGTVTNVLAERIVELCETIKHLQDSFKNHPLTWN